MDIFLIYHSIFFNILEKLDLLIKKNVDDAIDISELIYLFNTKHNYLNINQ